MKGLEKEDKRRELVAWLAKTFLLKPRIKGTERLSSHVLTGPWVLLGASCVVAACLRDRIRDPGVGPGARLKKGTEYNCMVV